MFLGAGAAAAVMSNPRRTIRAAAKLAVKGQDTATALASEMARVSTRVVEDFQDAVAEVRAEAQAAESTDPHRDLLAAVTALRKDIEDLRSTPRPFVQ